MTDDSVSREKGERDKGQGKVEERREKAGFPSIFTLMTLPFTLVLQPFLFPFSFLP
jgi:hypothetical protein